MKKGTVYFADPDPLFDELLERIPKETSRHHELLTDIGARIEEVLKRKGWSQADFAKIIGKKESEISRWLGGGHNFTIATIAKIEAALGEDILSVKKYRKTASGYSRTTKEKRRFLSEEEHHKYGKKK